MSFKELWGSPSEGMNPVSENRQRPGDIYMPDFDFMGIHF
jgi:hypothetical protein